MLDELSGTIWIGWGGHSCILVCRRVCEWWHSCHPSRLESVRRNKNVPHSRIRRQTRMSAPQTEADKNVRPPNRGRQECPPPKQRQARKTSAQTEREKKVLTHHKHQQQCATST